MTETQLTEDSALTYENILKLFKETEKRIKEIVEKSKETDERLDKQIKETDARFKEIAEYFKETDARFKETDARFKETASRFKETDARLDKLFKDARLNKLSKEVAEDFEETKRIVEETSKSVDALTSRWDKFIEKMVAPAALRLFRERGFEVNKMYKRWGASKDGIHLKIDILVVDEDDGDHAIVIEVKSILRVKDVNDHLKKLANFKHFFPLYKEKKVLGAVAGITIEDGVQKYAYKKGLFVIAQKGDDVEILNDEKFKASEW